MTIEVAGGTKIPDYSEMFFAKTQQFFRLAAAFNRGGLAGRHYPLGE